MHQPGTTQLYKFSRLDTTSPVLYAVFSTKAGASVQLPPELDELDELEDVLLEELEDELLELELLLDELELLLELLELDDEEH